MFQPPNIVISPVSVWMAGGQYTLTCTATFDEFLQATNSLMWHFPGNFTDDDDISTSGQSNNENVANTSLSFNHLHTSHGGMYVCEARVDLNGFTLHSQTTSEIVTVQSKLFI